MDEWLRWLEEPPPRRFVSRDTIEAIAAEEMELFGQSMKFIG